MNLGLQVFDDCDGYSTEEHDERSLQEHKQLVLDRINHVLNLGIPVIINLRDPIEDIGHYEVIIGIDENQNIILAEPGGALAGKLEFEVVPKDRLIERWKNMSGKLHGRFLIAPPNEASTEQIKLILEGLPHYHNGEPRNKGQSESLSP